MSHSSTLMMEAAGEWISISQTSLAMEPKMGLENNTAK
jgi:hypothetical protein